MASSTPLIGPGGKKRRLSSTPEGQPSILNFFHKLSPKEAVTKVQNSGPGSPSLRDVKVHSSTSKNVINSSIGFFKLENKMFQEAIVKSKKKSIEDVDILEFDKISEVVGKNVNSRLSKINLTENGDGVEIYSCDDCDMKTKYKVSFVEHLRIQHGDTSKLDTAEDSKGNQCPFCPKVLKHKNNLKLHIRDHHSGNQRSQNCPLCEKTFKNPGSLRSHKSQYHNE